MDELIVHMKLEQPNQSQANSSLFSKTYFLFQFTHRERSFVSLSGNQFNTVVIFPSFIYTQLTDKMINSMHGRWMNWEIKTDIYSVSYVKQMWEPAILYKELS